MTPKQPFGQGLAALLAYPFLFALLTFALLYLAVMPLIRPYVGLAGMFVNKMPEPVTERILFIPQTGDNPQVSTPPQVQPSEDPPLVETIPLSSVVKPNPGDLYGNLTVEGTNIDAPIYWGDSARELNAGIGTYATGWLPGFGRTIMMAGHRGSWLSDLGSAVIGGIITVETHYETYTYKIVDIAIVGMNDSSAYDFGRKDENLILYTCYPFDFVGRAKQRYFVYAEPLTGRPVRR